MPVLLNMKIWCVYFVCFLLSSCINFLDFAFLLITFSYFERIFQLETAGFNASSVDSSQEIKGG